MDNLRREAFILAHIRDRESVVAGLGRRERWMLVFNWHFFCTLSSLPAPETVLPRIRMCPPTLSQTIILFLWENTITKSNSRRKEGSFFVFCLFAFVLHFPITSLLLKEVKTGTPGRSWSRSHEGMPHTNLLLDGFLIPFSYTTQTLLPRLDTTHSGLGHPKSTSNQENAQQTCL